MTIRSRLALLLVCLVAVFGLAAAGLRFAHHAEAERILHSLREERGDLLDRLLGLTGQSLHSFATDYSLWDEMVGFAQSGDPAWAAINIEPSLASFDAQGAWVARTDGSLLYRIAAPGLDALPPPPLADPAFLSTLRRARLLHFFQDSPAGLLELRAAPILPSDDLKREQEPRGWFIVARLWDGPRLSRLSDTLQSDVSLAPAGRPAKVAEPTLIHLERTLRSWDGQPVRTLQIEYDSPPLALLMAGNEEEAWLLYAFGVLVILVLVVTLSRWVIRPLNQLTRSLETGEPAPLRDLQRGDDEFGHLARQVAQSFLQRDALRDSENRLRQWMALHERLGRDLHDGIIQSIYAAGLGLESARNLLSTDPAAAEQRLASCQRMFNDTLWQVRSFIHAIEPETPHPQSPAQSLTALVTTMQSLQSIPVIADIDPALAARIPPRQELHLLHIARELLSNALRHSGANQVRVSLQPVPDGLARLEVADDGEGFDPAAATTGHGLANLAARARELAARLEIDAAVGKGARIAVWFRPSN
ncbi:MAG: CHASE4 domain-containing protein [Verrucomicrobiota bacterium]